MAATKTCESIKYTFYWRTLQTDCQEYVKLCRTCQLKKRTTTMDCVADPSI